MPFDTQGSVCEIATKQFGLFYGLCVAFGLVHQELFLFFAGVSCSQFTLLLHLSAGSRVHHCSFCVYMPKFRLHPVQSAYWV